MTDREKLFVLIQDGRRCPEGHDMFSSCYGCKYDSVADCDVKRLADYLLAKGVTFATDTNDGDKWIPVSERLPDLIPYNAGTAYPEAVIVWTTGRKAMVAVWDGIDFLCAADYWEAWGETITHWMPLPEPPKEGE